MKFQFESDGDRDAVVNEIATQMKSASKQSPEAWPVISVVRDHVYHAINSAPKRAGDKVTVMIDIDVSVSVEHAARPAEIAFAGE